MTPSATSGREPEAVRPQRTGFTRAGRQVWLSDSGRRKVIDVVERRMADAWRHPFLEYSPSCLRHIEQFVDDASR